MDARANTRKWAEGLWIAAITLLVVSFIGAIIIAATLTPENCSVRTNVITGMPDVRCTSSGGAQFAVFLAVMLGAAFTLVPWFALSKALHGIADLLPVPDNGGVGGDEGEGLDELPGPGSPKPGWYPDPENDSLERRWTGTAWAFDPPRIRKR